MHRLQGRGADVEWARPDLCPLCSQCTFILALAWKLCVPPQFLQGNEKEEAIETEAIWVKRKWLRGPRSVHWVWALLALRPRPRTSFHKFRPMDLRKPGSCFPVLPLHPGQAEHWDGERVWSGKSNACSEMGRQMPPLIRISPLSGSGPPGWSRFPPCTRPSGGDVKLTPRGRWGSESIPICHMGVKARPVEWETPPLSSTGARTLERLDLDKKGGRLGGGAREQSSGEGGCTADV